MATHLHPLAHLTQVIHSEPSSFSDEPLTYILHSSVDSTKKHWKVRLYTFVGPDDAEGDEDDGNDGRGQGGIWLYKGYMTIKDITNHLSSRITSSISTTSSSKPSSESAQVTAASYLRDCILEGKSHIHVDVGDNNEDGGDGGRKGKRKRKRTKSNDGEGEIQSMHSEISLVLDHTHRSPLILPLTLSSPKMYAIPQGESTGNGNMDAQKGLMELCSEMVSRWNMGRKEEKETSDTQQQVSQSTASLPSQTRQVRQDLSHNPDPEIEHFKKQIKDLEQQIRLLQRRIPTSPSSAGGNSSKLPPDMKPIKQLSGRGLSRLQPTVKAPTKAVMGFADSDDDDDDD